MDTGLVLNGKAISLTKININSHLTVRQNALLKLLHSCLNKNKPLNWDLMVKFFVENVDKTYYIKKYSPGLDFKIIGYEEKSILKCYKDDCSDLSWIVRPRIRNWFANNIGSMVLKGSILALPIIELNDN